MFFSPTMIPSLALWFDAADATTITQSGGLISEWRDKSSNAYSVIQGTVGNQPTYATNILNGLPGVQLSGSRFLYQIGSSMPNFSSSPATTVYIVAKNGSTLAPLGWNFLNTMTYIGPINATPRYFFAFAEEYTSRLSLYTNDVLAGFNSSYSVPLNSNAIVGFAASATSNYLFFNGSNTAFTSTGAPPSANDGTWFFFGDDSSDYVTDENIYEFVGFNTLLTTAQQQAVEGYLATKWGLQSSLSNGHPFKTTPLPFEPTLGRYPPYPTSAVSNPEFDPRIFSGCILWLDGADPNGTGNPPANGTTLTTWTDKSVSNFPFTSVGSEYSRTAVNGLPGINIGTNFFGYDPGSAQNNWQEVFALGLWTGGSTFDTFNGLVTSSKTSDGGVQGGILFIGTAASSNWWNPGNTYVTQFVNGVQTNVAFPAIQNPFITRTHSVTPVNLQGLRFGIDREITDRKWIGFISEVICYNTALSTTQRQQVEAYLAKKWKISALSTQNIYAPGSYLTFVNAPRIPILPMRRAVQTNKFLPSQYSNCVLWLDAADVNGTGRNPATGTITSWTDKSGSGNSSTASGGTPTLTANSLNGKPGVAFSGTSYIQVPRVVTSDWSIFIVFSTTQTGPNSTPTPGPGQAHTDSLANHWWGGQGIFDGEVAGSVNDFGISLCGSPTAYLGYGAGDLASGTDTTEFSATAVNTGAGFIGEFFRTQTSGNLQMFVNGAFQVSTTGGTANRTSPTLKIGSIQTLPAGYYFTGNVYEIVCYTRVLNDIERQQIEGYFAWKWGLKASLGLGHPFFLIPPLPLP